jgi:hypothetical protein
LHDTGSHVGVGVRAVIDGFSGKLSRMTGGRSGGSIGSTAKVSALVILR